MGTRGGYRGAQAPWGVGQVQVEKPYLRGVSLMCVSCIPAGVSLLYVSCAPAVRPCCT